MHEYAFAAKQKQQSRRMNKWVREESDSGGAGAGGEGVREGERGGRSGGEKGKEEVEKRRGMKEGDKELERFLDGTHCFDEICTELMISEKELGQRLKARGDVQIICR